MAENYVVVLKEQLTDAMIDAGEMMLTRKLDEIGLTMNVALWLFDIEETEWRLILSSPEVGIQGSRTLYLQIVPLIDQLNLQSQLPLFTVRLMDINEELIRKLRSELNTGPGIVRKRYYRTVVGGRYIEDALIYRVV